MHRHHLSVMSVCFKEDTLVSYQIYTQYTTVRQKKEAARFLM
ncbi:hypothetical protein KN10_1239 [Anoxybacillus flavithermus NBRC 109594]|uniref:Uncharacterized protein n=1 Tax=Anoxybacillus flavithermus NBRC 109594 TaxID=1315967 RepID=R4G099_9BACL|nr:hypothetical protein KN10_1239 [Anoxybacillus flavithermus NBRC 109594]